MGQSKQVDVAIIGAGTAGMRAYREASKVTDSVLLIEGDQYGTTCARVGCMPSKLLIAAAEAAHAGDHAEQFGVHYGERSIDGKAVMQRVRSERDRFVGFVKQAVDNWPEEHRVMAQAKFLDDHTLELSNGDQVTADTIVIATGSAPWVPPILQGLGERVILNDDVFYWEDLPESIAVFGAGVIGLELGQALHRLGVRTSLFGKGGRIAQLTDPEVMSDARNAFSQRMKIYPSSQVLEVKPHGDGVAIVFENDGEQIEQHFQLVLAATGRRSNVAHLGLDRTSLALDDRGIPEYSLTSGQCGDSHIFIAGDANAEYPLLHEASDEGQVAGYNAARYPDIRNFIKSAAISVTFSDPQIMTCGQTHRELIDTEEEFCIGEVDWTDQGRSRVMGVNVGRLRAYGDPVTGKLLGAEMVGPRAEHLAHLLAWCIQSELTVPQILDRPFYHPVIEEGVRTALRNLQYQMHMGAKPPPRCLDCGPGA